MGNHAGAGSENEAAGYLVMVIRKVWPEKFRVLPGNTKKIRKNLFGALHLFG